jgi:hypothetical protein
MTNLVDYLRECISDPALVKGPMPIDEFNKCYCVRCIRTDCTRSTGNNLGFMRRVKNWRHDLFEAPPRAADNDPSFNTIRAKQFIQVSEHSNSNVYIPTFVSIEASPKQTEPELIQPKIPESTKQPEQTLSTPTITQINTPFIQGTILYDEQKIPQTPQNIELNPGGTFTFKD